MTRNLPNIPKVIGCIPGCADCCGPVSFTAKEAKKAFGRTGKWPSVSDDLTCCYAVGGRCEIYDIRPMICRVFAASADPRLKCPNGAWAVNPLSKSETARLIAADLPQK